MSIVCREDVIPKSQDVFCGVDKVITGFAFEIHNDVGRFCDEKIYQNIMLDKCRQNSIKADDEVSVVVSHNGFTKSYRLDLLVENGFVYELKAARELNSFHEQQLINYLLLTGLKHGKLLNFRSDSVEYRFVSTTLTSSERRNYLIDAGGWTQVTERCDILRLTLAALLDDWGAFLDNRLYNEALVHFLGGDEKIIHPVKMYFSNKVVGEQKMQLLDSKTAFHVSAIKRALSGYERNIIRLINHTNIDAVQWINFNRHNITMKTIR
jgi:GxxExxY protein